MTATPPVEDWPEPPKRTESGEALTDLILTTFRLNARLMEAAQGLAAHGGLTAAWWQVLGGVLDEPRSLSQIARMMGVSRQGVRRVAELLVDQGFAEYRSSPDHARAKLLACTERGYWAIRQIALVAGPWADRIAGELDADDLATTLKTARDLVAVLETDRA
jgi:DNA-binding MarR family transcriptional regulator